MIIEKFTNVEDGIESTVWLTHSGKYCVSLKDVDADIVFDEHRFYADLEPAIEYAKKIVNA